MNTKATYVKKQKQTREHTCHWPGCEIQVPPAMWGCSKHWFKLPKKIRIAIWTAYIPGQEINMSPTKDYVKAAEEAQRWINQDETL